jgi:hypothetical protein
MGHGKNQEEEAGETQIGFASHDVTSFLIFFQ